MKNLSLKFVLIFFNISFCQIPHSPAVEIFLGLENASVSHTIKMNSFGAVFGYTYNGNHSYEITNYYDHLDYEAPPNLSEGNWAGFDFVFSSTSPPTFDIYGFGFYKVTIDEGTSYFFLDYRDQRYGSYELYPPPSYGHDADIWIKYDDNLNQFFAKSDGGFDWNNPVPVGAILRIWDIKQKGIPFTDLFPDFWQNCLVIGAYIYQPLQIVWGPNPDQSNISKYFLYRKIDNQSFIKIVEFNNQTFDYKDKSILFTGDGSSTVSYKVTSFNGIEST